MALCVLPVSFIDARQRGYWRHYRLLYCHIHFLLMAQGWTDAIRKLYPNETIYTFFDYFRQAYERNAGLRIDHFLLSPHIDKRLIAAGVDRDVRGWEKSSDHAPVWIEIADE
jgi:exodeoxyribonuclease-3